MTDHLGNEIRDTILDERYDAMEALIRSVFGVEPPDVGTEADLVKFAMSLLRSPRGRGNWEGNEGRCEMYCAGLPDADWEAVCDCGEARAASTRAAVPPPEVGPGGSSDG